MSQNYVCLDQKPLFLVPDDYELTYNENGNVVLHEGTVCSDNYQHNSSIVTITQSFPDEFPDDFFEIEYKYVDGEFVPV